MKIKTGDKVTINEGVIMKHNKTDKVYCRGGDIVKVIALHDEVLIVEGKERYSIHISNVKK